MTISVLVFEPHHYAAARSLWEVTEGVGLSDADSQVGIEQFIERNPGTSFVAIQDNQLVGTILVGHDGRRGLIHHLAVGASVRRQGVGAGLVREGLAALGRAGIQKCHLLVFSNNLAGRAFWQAVGAKHRDSLVIYSLPTQ